MSDVDIKCPSCTYRTGENEPVIAAALLNVHATVHAAPGNSSSAPIKAPPVDRPKLQAACPKADWLVFKSRWESFKVATNLNDSQNLSKLPHQLLSCLEDDLAKLVYNETASPEKLNESRLLQVIEKVAVQSENVWVTRV